MKTPLLITKTLLQRLNPFPKLMLVAGLTTALALPQLEARPDHHRGDGQRGYSQHYGHGGSYRAPYRPAPSYHRTWSRSGYSGAYPPRGYVNYRYIHSLPRDYRVVYRDGCRYYYANGSYYWPARYNNSGIYINVRF
jgi:hypothetical protein